MTPKDIRTAISNQCGFNKTQPQRLLESIIPNKADDSWITEPVADDATNETREAEDKRIFDALSKAFIEEWRNDCSTRVIHTKDAKSYAIQVCNAGDWPDHLPSSFGDWLKANGDSVEISDQGGNFTADKIQANHDRYDNERHPFA